MRVTWPRPVLASHGAPLTPAQPSAHNRGGWDQGREAATGRVGPGAVLAAMVVLRRAGYLVRVSTGPPALPEPDTVLLMCREKMTLEMIREWPGLTVAELTCSW